MSKHRAITEMDEVIMELKIEAKKPRVIACMIGLVVISIPMTMVTIEFVQLAIN